MSLPPPPTRAAIIMATPTSDKVLWRSMKACISEKFGQSYADRALTVLKAKGLIPPTYFEDPPASPNPDPTPTTTAPSPNKFDLLPVEEREEPEAMQVSEAEPNEETEQSDSEMDSESEPELPTGFTSSSSGSEESSAPSGQTTSSSSDDDDFVTVGGKRARKSTSDKGLPPPKTVKTVTGKASPPKGKPAPVAAAASTSTTTTTAAAAVHKPKAPPPVIIHDPKCWESISKTLQERRVYYTNAHKCDLGIRVTLQTVPDYKSLTSLLGERQIPWHSYTLEEERVLRVVIRRIPQQVSLDYVRESLVAQNLPVREVHRMYRGRRPRTPYDMVLVVLDRSPAGKAIFKITNVAGLTGFVVEPPHKRGEIGQCHNCQFYGHSARHCHAKARCVKCLGDHPTRDCERTRESPGEPECVLCGASGHPANWRGCPKAPRSKPKQASPRSHHGAARNQRAPAATRATIPAPNPADSTAFPSIGQRPSVSPPKPAPRPAPQAPRASYAAAASPTTSSRPERLTEGSPRALPKPSGTGTHAASGGQAFELGLSVIVSLDIDMVEEIGHALIQAGDDFAERIKVAMRYQKEIRRIQSVMIPQNLQQQP